MSKDPSGKTSRLSHVYLISATRFQSLVLSDKRHGPCSRVTWYSLPKKMSQVTVAKLAGIGSTRNIGQVSDNIRGILLTISKVERSIIAFQVGTRAGICYIGVQHMRYLWL